MLLPKFSPVQGAPLGWYRLGFDLCLQQLTRQHYQEVQEINHLIESRAGKVVRRPQNFQQVLSGFLQQSRKHSGIQRVNASNKSNHWGVVMKAEPQKANSALQRPTFWLAPMAVLLWVMANTIAILPGKAHAGTANLDQVEMSLAEMEVQVNGVLQTAAVEAMSGRSAVAKVKLLSVLEKSKIKFGANGEVTIRVMESLAQVCELSGDLEEAVKYYQVIHGVKKIKYGGESEEALFALSDIAKTQFKLRNFEAAEINISKFIKGAEIKLGKDHIETLRAKENYAATLINVKKYQSAILAYDELVAIYKESNDQNGLKRAHSGRLLALAGVGDVQKITSELNGNQQICKWTGSTLDVDGIDSAITCLMLSRKSEEHVKLANIIYKSVKGKIGFEPQRLSLLYIIANGYFNGGKVALMSDAIIDFVDISESFRIRSTTSSEQRRVLFSDSSNDYQTFANWYAHKHELISAFNLGDLSKARTLTDSIKAKSALQSLSVTEQNQLQSLENRAEDLQKQFDFQVQSGKGQTGTLLALQKKQQEIKQQYASLQSQLKAKYPKYAQLIDIKPVFADAAKALLQPGEAFVSYLVRQSGEAQVYVLDQRGQPQVGQS
jgi:tetratricopeptide (TPR) repeat protein